MLPQAAANHRLRMWRVLPARLKAPGRPALRGSATTFIVVLHMLGWGGALLLAPPSMAGAFGAELTLAGLGLTAYLLGLRHAFDADHIAAIDGVTRKLVQQG